MDQNIGNWFSKLTVQDVSISLGVDSHSLNLNLFVFYQTSIRVQLDTMTFSGLIQTNPKRLIRESRLQIGQTLSPADLITAQNFIKQSLFIETVYDAELLRYPNNRNGFHFSLKELSTFFLNGIIGYLPGTDNEDAFFSTDIQIAYDNMSGTGRAIDLNWKKLNRQSESIDLIYTEPWLLDQPINGQFMFERDLVDSVFTKTSFALHFDLAINDQFTVSIFGKFSSTNPTDSVRALQNIVPFSEDIETGVSVRFFNTNRKYNPTNGIRSKFQFSRISSDVLRPDWLIDLFELQKNSNKDRLEFQIDYFVNHYDNHVLLFKNVSRFIQSDQLFSSDRYFFGGSKTIRGFRENQFNSRWYSQFGFEYRLLTSIDTRLFLFTDASFYETINKETAEIASFGFGARLKTGIGILGVDYAVEAGSAFRDGKIHIGIFGKID